MFMGEKLDTEEMLDIALKVAINENLALNSFALTYKTLKNQSADIKIRSLEPIEIVIADSLNLN